MQTWRDDVEVLIRKHLEHLISKSVKQRNAYRKAKNTANAQLWCALAEIARINFELEQENKLFKKLIADLNQKYKFLEKSLKEIVPEEKKKNKNNEKEIDPAKALRDVLKKI